MEEIVQISPYLHFHGLIRKHFSHYACANSTDDLIYIFLW